MVATLLFRFYPIDKTIYKKPYNPLMLTRDKYSIADYGTKYFREETSEPGDEVIYFILRELVHLSPK